MKFKFFILFLFFITSCTQNYNSSKQNQTYNSKGFAYIYNNEDFNIYFANGGDRKKGNVTELETRKNLNVVMLWGVGGGKIQSSSWLINGEEK